MSKPIQITSVQEDDLTYARVLLYGDPGVGKTPTIATEPKTLILNADPGGTLAARLMGSQAQQWDVRRHEDLTAAHEYLRHEGVNEFKWVWLDSWTIFANHGLRQVMEEVVARSPHRQLWRPDKGEYGTNMNRMKLWLDDMVTLPINIGITAHVMRGEDRETGNEVFVPAVPGKGMVDFVCGYMNIIAYMEATKTGKVVQRAIRVEKNQEYYGKDRYGALPGGVLLNPSIPRLDVLIDKAKERRPLKKAAGVKKVAKVTKVAKKAVPVKKATKATKKATRR